MSQHTNFHAPRTKIKFEIGCSDVQMQCERAREVPKKIHPESYFFKFKTSAKFHNPRTTPSGRKVCGGEKKEENNTNYQI